MVKTSRLIGRRAVCGAVGGVLATAWSAPNAFAAGDKPADAAAVAEAWERDPLKIIVSLEQQRLALYRGDRLVETVRVSTGRRGHRTPAGVYSIIQKRRRHFSNLYNNAPMPYMQRITWSGIAFHEGHIPGYPASHGCIRLPRSFARRLFRTTDMGSNVVIARHLPEPARIEHDQLFAFQEPSRFSDKLSDPVFAAARLDNDVPAAMAAAFDIELDAAGPNPDAAPTEDEIRVLITRRTNREKIREGQRLLTELGHDPGGVDGLFGSRTAAAVRSFQTEKALDLTGQLTDDVLTALYDAAGEPEMTGHLYIRRKQTDVFDMPVVIRDGEQPLGTHVFTAMHFEHGAPAEDPAPLTTADALAAGDAPRFAAAMSDAATVSAMAIAPAPEADVAPLRRPAPIARRTPVSWTAITVDAADGAASAQAALDRIEVPAEARAYIEARLTPNSTVIVSDAGRGWETGRGTDFIVQPR